jgi:hypothetical protein
VLLSDDIPEIDSHAEFDPVLRRAGGIGLGHSPLHLDRAANGINDARKLGEEAVAGVLYDPAAVLGDLWADQLPEMGLEPFVGPLLIHPHKARVSRHVGGQDRGEAASGGHL